MDNLGGGVTYILLVGSMLALAAGAAAWLGRRLLARWHRRAEARERVMAEDALKHLHAAAGQGRTASLESIAGALHLELPDALRLARRLEGKGWVVSHASGIELTPEGERLAVEVVRAHRLWERYLADEAGMPLEDIHAEAERREHARQSESIEALDAALGYPAHDPHGDPIPTSAGDILPSPGRPITDWPLHTPAQIAHLEDEPPEAYRQVLAQGLALGQVVHVEENTPQAIVFSDGRRTYRLAPVVAANVFVATPAPSPAHTEARTLDALQVGESARVLDLDATLQGFIRRRLLDLGLTPGVPVTAEMRSLFGDPTAYRVRGTLIALRRDQACKVHIAGEMAEARGDRQ